MRSVKWMRWGLLAVPASIVASRTGAETPTFVLAVISILPLAAFIGKATEELAHRMGQRLGGLLNATFGNAAELIIASFLIFEGEVEVVKVSITGSIIGNLLLVLGAAFFVGGLRYKEQSFNPKVAGMHTASMGLAVIGIMMPALFHGLNPGASLGAERTISIGVASVLMILYLSSLVFSFVTHQDVLGVHTSHEETVGAAWSKRKAGLVLGVATAFVALESEMLVSSLEHAAEGFGMSKLFIGLILIPIIGNAAEHSSAVVLAAKGKADIAIEIAAGSSTQIALFIAPLLVFIALIAGQPMDFFFSGFEVAVVGMSAAIVALIALDGRSNWLEGAQLIAAYAIVGLSFYFL